MSSDWKTLRLSELSFKITKGTTPTLREGGFADSGVNYIKAESIGFDGRIDESKFSFISESTHEKLKRSQLQIDDILFSMAGVNLGKTGIVEQKHVPANTNQALALIRPNKDIVFPKYLFYFLRQGSIVQYVNNSTSQSAQPNINLKEIGDLEIHFPDLRSQTCIAGILSSLDDKIELNRQINQTLEQIAQAMFKSWFVDFEPTRAKIAAKEAGGDQAAIEQAAMCAISGKTPDQLNQSPPETLAQLKATAALFPDTLVDSELGEIPKGWKVESLDKFIDVKHGFAFQGEFFTDVDTHKILLTPGNFKIGGGFKLDKYKYYSGAIPEDYILKKKDLLITMTDLSKEADTLGFPALVPEHDEVIFLHNQRLGKVVGKHEQLTRYFFYCLFRSERYRDEIISGITGTTVKHTAPRKILAFTHPFCRDLEKVFDDFAAKIFSNIECIELQNSSLKTLRDTLLPKLLSGDIQLQNNEETINV